MKNIEYHSKAVQYLIELYFNVHIKHKSEVAYTFPSSKDEINNTMSCILKDMLDII